jgi:hypothetical protein
VMQMNRDEAWSVTAWWADAVPVCLRNESIVAPPMSSQQELAVFAARHRLEPLLYLWGVYPAGRAAYLHGLARGERALREGLRLVGALEEAAIPVLPMRGPFAGHRWYGDAGARWFTDLDVLVPPRHVARARAVAGALGYEARQPALPDAFYRAVHLHYPLRQRERGLLLDLHWAVDHPFVRHRISYDELFAASGLTKVGAYRWRVPAPAHEILLQVAHLEKECGTPGVGAEERWARAAEAGQLLGLLDLARMVAAGAGAGVVEWESIAERWGLAPTASAWIHAARHPVAWRETARSAATVSSWEASGGFRRTRLAEARHYLSPPSGLGWWAGSLHRLRAGLHLAAAGAVAAFCLLVARLRSRRLQRGQSAG